MGEVVNKPTNIETADALAEVADILAHARGFVAAAKASVLESAAHVDTLQSLLDQERAENARLRQMVPGEWQSYEWDLSLKLRDAETKLAAIESLLQQVKAGEIYDVTFTIGVSHILHPGPFEQRNALGDVVFRAEEGQ